LSTVQKREYTHDLTVKMYLGKVFFILTLLSSVKKGECRLNTRLECLDVPR
jgi:hypothetical protein